jgi:AraC-like DNA-binding protein
MRKEWGTQLSIAADDLALRACRLFETYDLDDAQDRISRIMQPHRLQRQARGGSARSHMDFLRLRGVGLGTIAFGQGRIDVPPLDDYHLVVFCLAGSAVLRTGAAEMEIDRFQGIVCPAQQPLSGQFSQDCEQFVMRIDWNRLAAFGGGGEPHLLTRLNLRSARLQPFLSALRGLVTDPAAVQLIQSNAHVAGDYEQLLLRLFLAGQDLADVARAQSPVRPASVRRAASFIEANAAAPISLADIALAAGVAERTLHDAYCRFEGVSPMRALRDTRLDRVRARLQGDATANVTETALAAGFTHLGRFAQAYASRFGERPSETLRRR